MSIACFNDAKFALLIIADIPEMKEQRERENRSVSVSVSAVIKGSDQFGECVLCLYVAVFLFYQFLVLVFNTTLTSLKSLFL